MGILRKTLMSKNIRDMYKNAANLPNKEPINFNVSPIDAALIEQITKRGVADAATEGIELNYMMVQMDLTCTHCNGTPLRLMDMLHGDLVDFAHDLRVIGLGINRKTGQLHPDAARQLKFAVTKQ